MRLSDIQKRCTTRCLFTAGRIELPAEEIEGRTGEDVVITKCNTRLQAYRAPTQINCTGSGVAIQIGTASQGATPLGIELTDFGLRGTPSAVAGIRVESTWNDGTHHA